MHTDEGICIRFGGDLTAFLQFQKAVLFPRQAHTDPGCLQMTPNLAGQSEAQVFLDQPVRHRTAVMAAMPRIHDHQRSCLELPGLDLHRWDGF